MQVIKDKFFIKKTPTGKKFASGEECFINRLPSIPPATMKHLGWDYDTQLRMVATPTGVLIERDKGGQDGEE